MTGLACVACCPGAARGLHPAAVISIDWDFFFNLQTNGNNGLLIFVVQLQHLALFLLYINRKWNAIIQQRICITVVPRSLTENTTLW